MRVATQYAPARCMSDAAAQLQPIPYACGAQRALLPTAVCGRQHIVAASRTACYINLPLHYYMSSTYRLGRELPSAHLGTTVLWWFAVVEDLRSNECFSST